MKNTVLILLALLFIHASATAQSHRFTNPISAPLHFNPAFAGSVDDYRVSLAYRYAGAPYAGTQTIYGSYDQVSHRLHGGLGAEIYHDFRSDRMSDTRLSASYAGKFNLGSKWMFSPAVRLTYQYWSIQGFYFTDYNSPGLTVLSPLQRHGLNIGTAALLNTSNFYIGLTVDQLASVLLAETVLHNDVRLVPGTIWNIQSGYRFEPRNSNKWSLAATGLAVLGKDYHEFLGQVMYNRRWFLAGFGARVSNSPFASSLNLNYQASLGFKHKRFRILGVLSTYSRQFDLSLSLYLPRKKEMASPESSGM